MKAVGHQRMAVSVATLLIAPMSFVLSPSATAATKLGKVCTTINARSGSLTCVNKAGRLVWAAAPKTTKPKVASKVTTKPKAISAAAVTPPKPIVAPGASRGPVLPAPALPNSGAKPVATAPTTKPGSTQTTKPASAPAPAPVAGTPANAPTVPAAAVKPGASPSPAAAPSPALSPNPAPAPVAPTPAPAAATTTTTTTTLKVTPATNPPAGTSPIEGTWNVNTGEVGYRVKQTVSGQPFEAVGRTKNVTGSMVMEGTVLKSVEMTLATTTFKSEPADGKRDSGVQQVLETAKFPTATISLAAPFDLGQIPADKVEISKNVSFKLTLHGVAKNLTIPIKARRNGATVEIVGSAQIVFADFGIADPSRRPALISEDRGVVEFVVSFGR
jgi:polyisoprenoid-binding protein YceI